MTEHIRQIDINRLALNSLGRTEWARVRRHLMECDSCLHRLLDREAPLPDAGQVGEAGRAPVQPSAAIRAFVY